MKLHLPNETINIDSTWTPAPQGIDYAWTPEPIHDTWLFYYRRGDKYFFRNKASGMKIAVRSADLDCKFVRGEEYEIKYNW